jgi:hypothetical protein
MQFKFCFVKISWPYNPKLAVTNLVWAFPRPLATTNGIIIIFSSSGYLDVSVPRVCLHCWIIHLQCTGLSHSEICGSNRMCQSPQLIAAYHVLHRLWEPRHSPYALTYFLVCFISHWPFTWSACSVMFYSYSMSKNFLLVNSNSTHPNDSPASCFTTSSNVVLVNYTL